MRTPLQKVYSGDISRVQNGSIFLACQVHISGDPLMTVSFDGVPSRNARKQTIAQSHINRKWRRLGEAKALEAMGRDCGFLSQFDPLVKVRSFVICTVYLRDYGIADVHNPDIKPILDGFTDAGVWPDDEWAHVPLVLFAWGGFSDTKVKVRGKKRLRRLNRVVLEVYDLHSYWKHSESQDLPEGRVWVDSATSKKKSKNSTRKR